jgi:hypothetical protein
LKQINLKIIPFSKLWPGSLSAIASFFAIIVLLVPVGTEAALDDSHLKHSIVTVNVYTGKKAQAHGSGFVVQSDRFNGYVITNAEFLEGADTLTVSVPNTGAEMVAKILRFDASIDFALLKISGLNLPPLAFSQKTPDVGDVVWSAVKWSGDNYSVGLSRGTLRNSYETVDSGIGVFKHSAMLGEGGIGSILLNDCGQVVGMNMSTLGSDSNARAIDVSSLRTLLSSQNIKVTYADSRCISEVDLVKSRAEAAVIEARSAQKEAEKAQALAISLEKKLQSSNQRNDSLLRQTREARRLADQAIVAAESARLSAEKNKQELEKNTRVLKAETEAMKIVFEQSQADVEQRFQGAIREQEAAAEKREMFIIGLSFALFIAVVVIAFVSRRNVGRPVPAIQGVATPNPESDLKILEVKSNTELHTDELKEFVLDGRDEDGIRYLLRISGDKLLNDNGVVIGRNPKDSPYIINHADVSRKHARMKVMKNRVFIEDLGSTNGTSVNGQSIEEKGPVSVDTGDQIIIGSVVMNLRVLSA